MSFRRNGRWKKREEIWSRASEGVHGAEGKLQDRRKQGKAVESGDALTQERAPIYEALEAFQKMRVVPFDVPGHKRGRGNPELTKLLGETCMRLDVNSMKPLDNLCHPVSVIADAEQLAAEAFGAAHAFLMVGGTTSAVQSMGLTAVKRGEKIILPRNVHRSVMGAMVLGGAVPVYVNPAGDKRLGIPLGMRVEDVRRAIKENPDAKAVFVNNPTYYGICSDLRSIVKLAHEHGMLCLVDEAHGTHFYFGENMPVSAMAAGADMAAVSMHKSGGSLTQSSILLTGPGMSAGLCPPDYQSDADDERFLPAAFQPRYFPTEPGASRARRHLSRWWSWRSMREQRSTGLAVIMPIRRS